ncbi:hypothetical protein ACHAXM_011966 [Skeletonema potamos]
MATSSGLIGSGGGAAGYNNNTHRGNSSHSRNNNRGTTAGNNSGRKKFGKNLNKVLSKTPAAPPVPVITTSSGSQSLFRGSSSSNNGLLLLSTKSKTSGSSSGLLQPLGYSSASSSNNPSTSSPKTAHDALLLSAAGVATGEGGVKKSASGPVWGRERQSSSLENKQSGEEQEDKKPAAALLTPSKSSAVEAVRGVEELSENMQKLNLHKGDDTTTPPTPIRATKQTVTEEAQKPVVMKKAVETKQPQLQNNDDEMATFMSKLAKERAEKIQSEEEARTLQQREAVALRLKELEEKKRLVEAKKKQSTPPPPPPPPPPPLPLKQNSAARRDASKPSSNIVLEPLGKPKKNVVASPKPKTPVVEKIKKLYDPDRPYSSLVGGSSSKPKKNDKQSSKDVAKKEEKPVLVHLDGLDDHGRRNNTGDSGGGPRMLFDPTSGSMVKASKKVKQQTPKVSDDTAEKLRHVDKSLRREKKGGAGRKDDFAAAAAAVPPSSLHSNKDRKAQKQLAMQRIPRTCGVLFKVDKNGNYVNVDRCEADNGYGAHRVPGGRIRNPTAYAQLLEEEQLLQEQQAHTDGNLNAAAESFSFRNDPGFVQHQTEFEAQQQKILEDAWASLVETDEQQQEVEEKPKAKSSVDDDYAAALAMSPSIIGLNFDQNESSDSIMLPPAVKANTKLNKTPEPSIDFPSFSFADSDAVTSNPFGGGLWGNTAGGNELGALSGWHFTSTRSEKQDRKTSTSKLNLWGSSILDSPTKKSSDEPSSNGIG